MRLLVLLAFALSLSSCREKSAEITVTAPATFERRAAGGNIGAKDRWDIYLRIFDGTTSYDVLWGREDAGQITTVAPIVLTPGKEYDFTLVQETPSQNDVVYHDEFKVTHVVRIVEPERHPSSSALYDREICEVHRSRMRRTKVPIVYGLLGYGHSDDELKTLFPHHQDFVAGGCIDGDKKTDRIFVCPDCKQVYKEWSRTNNRRALSSTNG